MQNISTTLMSSLTELTDRAENVRTLQKARRFLKSAAIGVRAEPSGDYRLQAFWLNVAHDTRGMQLLDMIGSGNGSEMRYAQWLHAELKHLGAPNDQIEYVAEVIAMLVAARMES